MKTKTILLLAALFISILCNAQKINEKQAITKSHIDFNKEYLWFRISGLVEIDGHTFNNDTAKCPIIYTANASEVNMYLQCDSLISFTKRICGKRNCNILHLIQKVDDNSLWEKWHSTYQKYNQEENAIKVN